MAHESRFDACSILISTGAAAEATTACSSSGSRSSSSRRGRARAACPWCRATRTGRSCARQVARASPATFASDFTRNVRKKRGDAEELPRGVMPRHASIVLGENGGRVVLISPHLEDGEPAARRLAASLRAVGREDGAAERRPAAARRRLRADPEGVAGLPEVAVLQGRDLGGSVERAGGALARGRDAAAARRDDGGAAVASRPSSRASSPASPRHPARIKSAIGRAGLKPIERAGNVGRATQTSRRRGTAVGTRCGSTRKRRSPSVHAFVAPDGAFASALAVSSR